MKLEILKENGLKSTKSRKLVLRVLEEKQVPMTVEEVYQLSRSQLPINYSTVYRILLAFADKSIVLKSVGIDGMFYFRYNNHKQVHSVICTDCHKKIVIEDCPMEDVVNMLVEKTGFRITGLILEFIGQCPECYNNPNANV